MEYKLVLTTGFLFVVGSILITLTHIINRPTQLQIKKDWLKYGVYFIIVSGLLMIGYLGRWLIAIVMIAIAIGGAVELNLNLRFRSAYSGSLSNAFFLILLLALGHLLLKNYHDWYPAFAFIFLIVSVTDSYSQLFGRFFGKHKLCPNLSPYKTWEGLVGGIVSAMIIACLLRFLLTDMNLLKILGLGLTIALSATTGDLLFSCIKRKIGIKDFSGILPGHGGILDRFDSLIVAAPVTYWAWLIIFY
jgi:phosphatidate cytidylyltransferase